MTLGYAKYIVTKNNDMIVFTTAIQHSRFRHLEPKSAGFISFGKGENGYASASCHGESISLRLKSNPEEDNRLAKMQILNYPMDQLF